MQGPITTHRQRWLFAALLVPAALFCFLGAAGPRPAPQPPPPFAWICDRDADQLVAVDAGLVTTAYVSAPCPVRVRARRDGTAWCVLPQNCGPTGRHDLARARPGGALGRLLALAPIRDLECLDGDDALVLEGDWAGSATRFLRVDESGAARQLATWPDAIAVAGHMGRVVVGTTTGDVVLFDAAVGNGPPLARAALGAEIGDLAPAPGGGWWVLVVTGGSSLVRLDDQLHVLWSTPLGGSVLDLASVPGEELVWLPRSTEPWLLAVGDGGRKLADLDLAAIGDVDRGDGFAGGCLLASPGFVLRVAGGGSTLMTQGGFDRVLDLSITPP